MSQFSHTCTHARDKNAFAELGEHASAPVRLGTIIIERLYLFLLNKARTLTHSIQAYRNITE